MSRSLNRAELIGHVGQDPELRSTQNGSRVATFSLATSESWTDGRGEKQEKTQWHRCVVWNRGQKGGLADVVEQYVHKGDKLYVSGKIEYRKWEDKDGQTRYSTEITVNELMMLGGKGGEGSEPPPARSNHRRDEVPGRSSRAASRAPHDEEFDDFPSALTDEDDDLPFDGGAAVQNGDLFATAAPKLPDALRNGL